MHTSHCYLLIQRNFKKCSCSSEGFKKNTSWIPPTGMRRAWYQSSQVKVCILAELFPHHTETHEYLLLLLVNPLGATFLNTCKLKRNNPPKSYPNSRHVFLDIFHWQLYIPLFLLFLDAYNYNEGDIDISYNTRDFSRRRTIGNG